MEYGCLIEYTNNEPKNKYFNMGLTDSDQSRDNYWTWHDRFRNRKNTETKENKGCNTCKSKQNQKSTDDKTCKTCKKNLNKFLPYMILSVALFGFSIYGIVTFIKDVIALFTE